MEYYIDSNELAHILYDRGSLYSKLVAFNLQLRDDRTFVL